MRFWTRLSDLAAERPLASGALALLAPLLLCLLMADDRTRGLLINTIVAAGGTTAISVPLGLLASI